MIVVVVLRGGRCRGQGSCCFGFFRIRHSSHARYTPSGSCESLGFAHADGPLIVDLLVFCCLAFAALDVFVEMCGCLWYVLASGSIEEY